MFKAIMLLTFISTSAFASIFTFSKAGQINETDVRSAASVLNRAADLGSAVDTVEKTSDRIFRVDLANRCSFYAAAVFSADENPKVKVVLGTSRCDGETIQD